eukprot:m.356812 g.356812  ORF g.356812 m.356812 type:complete len:384 (+) comp17633_c0_seq1:216-1367(+)
MAANASSTATLATTTSNNVPTNPPATWAPLEPTLPPNLHIQVTASVAALLCLITLILTIQVLRLFRFGYRKTSYFALCLYSSLVWGILRSSLLLLYATRDDVAGRLNMFVYLFLFVVPAYLQFACFSLLVLYYSKAVLRPKHLSRLACQRLERTFELFCIFCNAGFLVTNIVCAIVQNARSLEPGSEVMVIRVVTSEAFFIIVSLALVYAACKYEGMSSRMEPSEREGVASRKLLVVACVVSVLFLFRSAYNIVAAFDPNLTIWGFRWTFLSDQADRDNDNGWSFVLFVCGIFLWELVPVCCITGLFWVKRLALRVEAPLTNPSSVQTVHKTKLSDQDSGDEYSVSSLRLDDPAADSTPLIPHSWSQSYSYGSAPSFEQDPNW